MNVGISINNEILSNKIIEVLGFNNNVMEYSNNSVENFDLIFIINISNRNIKSKENDIEVYYDSLATISLITEDIVDLCLISNINSITYRESTNKTQIRGGKIKSVLINVNKHFEKQINDVVINKLIEIINKLL